MSSITSVIIPPNVKRLEELAFIGSYIKNATFMGPLDYIGESIFEICDQLELIIFPNVSIIVDALAFVSYFNLKVQMAFTHKTLFSSTAFDIITNVSISYLNESNLIIDKQSLIMNYDQSLIYEFWGYNFLSLTIPTTVQTIKESAFENSSISEINFQLNSELSAIENNAFRNCSNLKSFSFMSNNFNSLGSSVFKDCIKLVFVTNIKDVPESCFSGCTSLQNVTFRNGATFIGPRSFENCISIESINIPSTIETISEYSFINCIQLKSIVFSQSNSLSSISINAFSGCDSIESINNFESTDYKCIQNTLYIKNEGKLHLVYHVRNSPEKVIIINCFVIKSYSFDHCFNIENISILSDSVTLIESNAFNSCLNLKFINFPLSIQTVQPHSFNDCPSIRCPLRIENKTLNYFDMIEESGISRNLLISCIDVLRTNNVQLVKQMYESAPNLYWKRLSKL